MKFVISLVNLVYVAMSRNRTQYVPTMVKSSLYLLFFLRSSLQKQKYTVTGLEKVKSVVLECCEK